MSTDNLWDRALGRIESKVNKHSFYTWFKPTAFVADRGSQVIVRVPNPVFRDWLNKHYAGVIRETLTEIAHAAFTVEFVTEEHATARAGGRAGS